MLLNIEIKARTARAAEQSTLLLENGAQFKGKDLQTDTYFRVDEGRMKLREGNIENNLIHYLRKDEEEAKVSEVLLYKTVQNDALKSLLTRALGVLIRVKKTREIYFIDNVKFHIDEVKGLGSFIEIEAIATDDSLSEEHLREQCEYYQKLLGIEAKDLVAYSYSDLLFQNRLGNKNLLINI